MSTKDTNTLISLYPRIYNALKAKKGEFFNNLTVYRIGHDTMYTFVKPCEDCHEIIFVFEASNDPFDWVSNFFAYPLREDVHGSWYKHAKKFRDVVRKIAQYYHNADIMCCGSSRGGSLAVETFRYLSKLFREDHVRSLSCVTSGCPPIGGDKYIEEMEGLAKEYQVINFIHPDDIVPRLPLLKGYKRFGSTTTLFDAPKRNLISAHLNYGTDISNFLKAWGFYDTASYDNWQSS